MPPPLNSDLLNPIANIVGNQCVITGADQTPYLTEWRARWPGSAGMIVAPQTTEQVSKIVRYCSDQKIAITPQGGNTGLVGGQIPFENEILITLKRLRKIHEISPLDNAITVDAGLTLSEVQDAAASANRLFPLSIGSEGSCQIGGVISTNAGGVNVLRYGNTRDLVLDLEAVLPNGEIWPNGTAQTSLKKLRKDNTGYDFKQLLIGGEGTLGIITKASLKLFPAPLQAQTFIAACPTPNAVINLLAHFQEGSGGLVSSFELMEHLCLEMVLRHIPQTRNPFAHPHPVYAMVELTSGHGDDLKEKTESLLASAIDHGLIVDAVLAANEKQRKDFWKLRHSISEALNGEGVGARHDVSVPTSTIPEFLSKGRKVIKTITPQARIAAFGHVGDGNIHYDIIPADGAPKTSLDHKRCEIEEAVYDLISEFNGSISAEHGIGTHKRESLARRKSIVEMATMRAIKTALDPAGIMNPGKLI